VFGGVVGDLVLPAVPDEARARARMRTAWGWSWPRARAPVVEVGGLGVDQSGVGAVFVPCVNGFVNLAMLTSF
jgi:hypothetical protein